MYVRMWARRPVEERGPSIGDPRALPDGWDDAWQGALVDWMAVENLEERIAGPGWIDPAVVEFIRRQAAEAGGGR